MLTRREMVMWFLVLLTWLSVTNGKVHEPDEWYERHTTQDADIEPPDVKYQEILFEATEMLLSTRYQLELIMEAYNNANWTTEHARNLKVIPGLFNETTKIINVMNRTLERKVDLGYVLDRELTDPIDKVTGEKLIERFQEMKKYVDRLQTDTVMEEKNVRRGTVEMRMHINDAIHELEDKIPYVSEQMRLLRNRVTKGPY